MLLNIIQCKGQHPSATKNYRTRNVKVLRLRNPAPRHQPNQLQTIEVQVYQSGFQQETVYTQLGLGS